MTFDLTDGLLDSIIKALENQTTTFCVDALNLKLVEESEETLGDAERFYPVPGWNSADGFFLMESFVNGLHAPMAYASLQEVLHSGKGVFRGFKDVLKNYPEVQRKWHYYKNRQLMLYVSQWYNSLRETWGLERLDCETDDIEDLVCNDFVFQEYNHNDRNALTQCLGEISYQCSSDCADEVDKAVKELGLYQFEYGNPDLETGFTCRTVLEEFAGCIVTVPCPSESKNTVLVKAFFVLEKYRGLGIGKELLERQISNLSSQGIQWVIIANTFIPDNVESLFVRSGFEKTGSGYVANLFAEKCILP